MGKQSDPEYAPKQSTLEDIPYPCPPYQAPDLTVAWTKQPMPIADQTAPSGSTQWANMSAQQKMSNVVMPDVVPAVISGNNGTLYDNNGPGRALNWLRLTCAQWSALGKRKTDFLVSALGGAQPWGSASRELWLASWIAGADRFCPRPSGAVGDPEPIVLTSKNYLVGAGVGLVAGALAMRLWMSRERSNPDTKTHRFYYRVYTKAHRQIGGTLGGDDSFAREMLKERGGAFVVSFRRNHADGTVQWRVLSGKKRGSQTGVGDFIGSYEKER